MRPSAQDKTYQTSSRDRGGAPRAPPLAEQLLEVTQRGKCGCQSGVCVSMNNPTPIHGWVAPIGLSGLFILKRKRM